MTWQEVSNLFNAIATGLSLNYEEGAADQINMIFQGVDKYPLCYALPGRLLSTGDSADGPEMFVWRYWDCQIAFLEIDSTFATSPDMNNLDRTQLRSAMIEAANKFKYNLYESSLMPDGVSVLDCTIDQLTLNQSGDAAFGALLEFKLRTLDNLDCDDIVS